MRYIKEPQPVIVKPSPIATPARSMWQPAEALLLGARVLLVALMSVCSATSHAELKTVATTAPAGPPQTSARTVDTATLEQQREDYKKAEAALRQGQLAQYRNHRQRIEGYPLAIYLDYHELRKRLSTLPSKDVEHFLATNQHSFLSNRLRFNWLNTLAEKSQWATFIKFYEPEIANTELACQALYARLQQGDQSALQEVSSLWAVPQSQPKQCDPLFDRWVKSGGLTADIAWERFNKALRANNLSLAKYAAKQLDSSYSRWAELSLQVYQQPALILQHRRFNDKTPQMQEIIAFGLSRYARQEPMKALKAWEDYDKQHKFSAENRLQIQEQLAIQLVRNQQRAAADELMAGVAQINDTFVAEWLIREALKAQDWPIVYRYLNQLSPADRNTEHWRYWRARSMEEMKQKSTEASSAKEIYTQLAKERSYYGFLAADRLGLPYRLNDIPVAPPASVISAVANHPAMTRAQELLALNDELNATREWYHMSTQFQLDDEHLATAQLSYDWGWYQKAIISLANVKAWDDLQLRFPLAHSKEFLAAAKKNEVSPLLLFAIARQESAFAAHARSRVGATGLMQLMPATAKQTARKAGIPYEQKDLTQPATNILLGSAYITELLDRFDNNRILAAAAYNAGPHRVNQWLARSDKQLPHDVWVEVIPFKETRKYVQNVLAYSVIYGYRMGTTPLMLNPHEQKTVL